MMAGLVEVLTIIGDENISHQQLGGCITSVKDKKRDKCTEISFVTDAITTTEIARRTGKVGIVIWIDRDQYQRVFDKIKGSK